MHKLVAALAVSLCLVFGLAASASAAVVVFHSAADNTYGWCANGSYTYCEQAAEDHCVAAGGKDCRFVLECSGGWGAMTFGETGGGGFGASCHTSDAASARNTALIACIKASNTLCWTSSTFSTSGRQSSESSNLGYDQTYYAQFLLFTIGLYTGPIDASMGPRTRAAVAAFQSRVGLAPTGIVDDRLIELLTYAAEGKQREIDTILSTLSPDDDSFAKYTYGYATAVAPRLSFSAELAAMADDRRRLALATDIATNNLKCSLPATRVEAVSVEDGAWNVDCAEGPYFVVFADTATIITSGHGTMGNDTPAPNTPPHQPTSPAGVAAPAWSVPASASRGSSAHAPGGGAKQP